MQPFHELNATAVPLREENVDTDQIIPARYLTAVTKEGMGDGLFSSWRYLAGGAPNPDFVLNQPQYKGAEVLIAGRNFGSGSSREHAVWAITEYGFKCVIAARFRRHLLQQFAQERSAAGARCLKKRCSSLWDLVEEDPTTTIEVDLASQKVVLPDGQVFSFEIDPFRKMCLLEGVDDLGYIQLKEPAIAAFEASRPW